MSYPVTATQLAAFMSSHEMSSRVVLIRGAQNLGDIDFIDVEISATYGTQGGRSGTLSVDRNQIDAGLLNPLSDEVIVYTGIRGEVEVPIFTGRVDNTEVDEDGFVRVPLISRGDEAVRADFLVPWAALPGNQARNEIARILRDVNPSWGVETSGARGDIIPNNLVFETERGQACDQLAQGANLIWQPDRTGGFTVYNNPYSVGPILGAGVSVILRDGEGGCVTQVRKTTGRQGIWNAVTVVTERVNNTEPIRVTAMDTDPSSPTYWGGLFGKQNLVVKNQTPLDVAGSQLLALRILRQSLAQQRSFSISLPHFPLLDPGDVFGLWYRGVIYTLVCEAVSYSGNAQMPTSITARELILRDSLSFV
jgi:hypothetical protein